MINNVPKKEIMDIMTIFVLDGSDGMESQGYKYFACFNDKGGIYLKSLNELGKKQRYVFNNKESKWIYKNLATIVIW